MSFFGAFSRGTPSKTAAVPGTAGKADGAAVTSADSPLELISYNTQTGKFHVGEAAVQVLRKVSFLSRKAEGRLLRLTYDFGFPSS